MRAFRGVKVPPRVLILRLLARLHCGLIAAAVCVLAGDLLRKGFSDQAPEFQGLVLTDGQMGALYLRGLLFAVPVALSWYAAEHLPALWQFLLASLGIGGLSWLLLGNPAGAVLAALVCFFRGRARLAEEKTPSVLDTPSYWCLLVFLLAFFVSAVGGMPMTQRLSVISGALYFLVCLGYNGGKRVDDYLVLNKGMHGLPARRIQRIAGAAAAGAVLLSGALLLPAAFRVTGGFSIDLSQLESGRVVSDQPPEDIPPMGLQGPDLSELELLREGESWQLPEWALYLLYALALAWCCALALYGLYQLFKNYRASFREERDEVRFLSGKDREEPLEEGEREQRRPRLWDRSPNAQVRRRYRKAVLHAAKEPPRRWQAPEEIETSRGLEVPVLHGLYEKARYGNAPCTQEEARALKERS